MGGISASSHESAGRLTLPQEALLLLFFLLPAGFAFFAVMLELSLPGWRKNFAVSVGDMFVWGVEESWGRTGELARKKLLAAAGKKGFWGQVMVGVHAGEKA